MNSAPTNSDDSTDETAHHDRANAVDSDRLMAEFSIIRSGRYYWFDGYRYEHLEDAVAYAQVIRARRQASRANASLPTRFDIAELPNASDRQLMTELSITLENGCFVFDGFHYDRLIDAANYARLRGSSAADAT